MWRVILEPAAFFIAPFAAYAIYLVLRLRYPFALASWSRTTVSILTLLGLAAAVVAVFGFGLIATQHQAQGPWIPPKWENGKVVPGHFQ